jgi:hypothetical protein
MLNLFNKLKRYIHYTSRIKEAVSNIKYYTEELGKRQRSADSIRQSGEDVLRKIDNAISIVKNTGQYNEVEELTAQKNVVLARLAAFEEEIKGLKSKLSQASSEAGMATEYADQMQHDIFEALSDDEVEVLKRDCETIEGIDGKVYYSLPCTCNIKSLAEEFLEQIHSQDLSSDLESVFLMADGYCRDLDLMFDEDSESGGDAFTCLASRGDYYDDTFHGRRGEISLDLERMEISYTKVGGSSYMEHSTSYCYDVECIKFLCDKLPEPLKGKYKNAIAESTKTKTNAIVSAVAGTQGENSEVVSQ